MRKPLAADLYCGLGGWTEGLIAEGWRVRGYDIEAHEYGDERYPGEFVLRDILQMHGSEVADVDLIVSSSPCTDYSYMAMPWTLAKAKAAVIRADTTGDALRRLNALFDAQFRIQREACEAAGRYIPMVVENVRGAQPWVGRARGNFGSFYLWGDVPALMPEPIRATKVPGFRFDGSGGSFQTAAVEGVKRPGRTMCFPEGSANPDAVKGRTGKLHWVEEATKVPTESSGRRTDVGKGARFTSRDCGVEEGRKQGGDWFSAGSGGICRTTGSKSSARKRASAQIAKIPLALSEHIARVYHPDYSRFGPCR